MNILKRFIFNVRIIIAVIADSVENIVIDRVQASRISTTDLVNALYNFCEAYSGMVMYTYQAQFSKRVIRSVLENDGAELTALFARQSGKTETISITVGGLMIILPQLANMPMFADDPRVAPFKDGLWVGIFAPSQRQAQITYGRMKSRIQSETSIAIMQDPDFRLSFTTSNGETVALSNGSFVTAISASDSSNIEGESFKFIICEEAQDISNFKVRKCLTGDTKILLADGNYKRLDEIVKDKKDELVCYGKDMKTLTKRVPYEFYDNGVQPVYKIVLDDGQEVEATINHKFYTYNQKTRGEKCKFRTVEEIINSLNNDRPLRIGVADSLPYFAEEQDLDYERGLLVGYFLGDGCLRGGSAQFIGDTFTCERILDLFRRVVSPDIEINIYKEHEELDLLTVAYTSVSLLRPFFSEYEIWGKKGEDKYLPDRLFSKSFYKGLVEALIETDGCIESAEKKPIISFANISEKLVLQLKDIYLKFGIHATVFSRENTNGFGGENSKPLNVIHVKSVLDILRFKENFKLAKKQGELEKACICVKNKETRERSKYYPSTMRFSRVKSIELIGNKQTYCVNMDKDVEGIHNIIIESSIISGQSIHPMGAAYNATVCKIGTATTFKGDFYEAIERNKKDFKNKKIKVRSHFEYNYKVVQKYNPKYAKYIQREIRSLGENSDEFRMSYGLEWIIERGMFCDIEKVEKECGDPYLERVSRDFSATHCVGIDVGGGSNKSKDADSTVITVVEVDWDSPVLLESSIDEETGQEVIYLAYNTYIKDWLEISPEIAEDYEEQYALIMEYLKNFNIVRLMIDSTKESSLAHRIKANVKYEVIPFVFSSKSKSDIYKYLSSEIGTARARFPRGENTVNTPEYRKFTQQLSDLQKSYSGSYMVVSHPQERGSRDDYCDSWALAVYATKDPGYIDETETVDKFKVMNDSVNMRYRREQSRKNRLTARRR